MRAPGRRWFDGLLPLVYNLVGTAGFVVGSFLWCVNMPVGGTYIFAAACVSCAGGCVWHARDLVKGGDLARGWPLIEQAAGCLIFTAASFLFLHEDYLQLALIGFLSASLLFLCGCTSTQSVNKTWTGVVATLWPGTPNLLPTSLLNSAGSLLFTLGSIFLFYAWGQLAGAWCYAIGSVLFFFAAWGDATIWWELGLAQTEQQHAETVACCEEGLGAVKLV